VRVANLMATTEPVSEDDLESTLRTDPDYAIELLDLCYQEQIIQYIKRETWGRLRPDELMVAYQETMLAFIRRVREEGFDPSRPLRLVYCIARRRGFDQLRARRHRMSTNEEERLAAIAASLKDTEAGSKWLLLTPAQRKEFREIVLAEAAKLPERQKIVATCYVDCFEVVINEGSFRALAEEVSRVTGNQETVAAVKSAWHVARKKIAPALERRGYNFIPVE
jgi:hypothetical protein